MFIIIYDLKCVTTEQLKLLNCYISARACEHSMRGFTFFGCVQELRNDAELQEGNLGWLKARMAVLIEISAESDGQRQGNALVKLSADFKGLLASLSEVDKL